MVLAGSPRINMTGYLTVKTITDAKEKFLTISNVGVFWTIPWWPAVCKICE